MLLKYLHLLLVATPLEKTVLTPVPTEAIWDNRKIRNPDQTAQKAGPGGIKEFLAGEFVSLRLLLDVMWLQLGCFTSREIRINEIRALRDVDLFMLISSISMTI